MVRIKKLAYILLIVPLIWFGCASRKKMMVAAAPGSQVLLPKSLQSKVLEFSSMEWFGSELLLVPQYPDKFSNEIYGISTTDIDLAMSTHKEIVSTTVYKISNLEAVKSRIGTGYQGFEATQIVEDHIYFTIESDSADANCYLIGGKISGRTITIDPAKFIALPKLKRLSNAGYESLGYLKDRNKLAAFFEYNKSDVGSKAWLIDTAMKAPLEAISFYPLMFRITDVTPISGKRLLGINHFYYGKKEFREYLGADTISALPSLSGKSLRETCYTSIIELKVRTNKISWKTVKEISFGEDNWEGIVAYKKGVLIITDEFPGSVLTWYKL